MDGLLVLVAVGGAHHEIARRDARKVRRRRVRQRAGSRLSARNHLLSKRAKYIVISAMEISDVRRLVLDTLERAKGGAAERRARTDAAERAYTQFLENTAVPLVRQLANVLKAHAYQFTVFTPGGSVRL